MLPPRNFTTMRALVVDLLTLDLWFHGQSLQKQGSARHGRSGRRANGAMACPCASRLGSRAQRRCPDASLDLAHDAAIRDVARPQTQDGRVESEAYCYVGERCESLAMLLLGLARDTPSGDDPALRV